MKSHSRFLLFGTAVLFAAGMTACTTSFTVTPQLTLPPTLTPTATPNPCLIWTFESNTTEGWSVPYWNPVCSSTAVTALSLLGAPAGLGSYGLKIILPPAGCSVGVNDVQAQVSSGTCPGFPVDFAAMGLTGVRCQIWVNPNVFSVSSSEVVAACPYVQVPGPIYGGCYNGWPAQNPQTIASPGGAWRGVTLIPSGPSWATDKTNVIAVGIEVNEATAYQPLTADVVVDNFQFF